MRAIMVQWLVYFFTVFIFWHYLSQKILYFFNNFIILLYMMLYIINKMHNYVWLTTIKDFVAPDVCAPLRMCVIRDVELLGALISFFVVNLIIIGLNTNSVSAPGRTRRRKNKYFSTNFLINFFQIIFDIFPTFY